MLSTCHCGCYSHRMDGTNSRFPSLPLHQEVRPLLRDEESEEGRVNIIKTMIIIVTSLLTVIVLNMRKSTWEYFTSIFSFHLHNSYKRQALTSPVTARKIMPRDAKPSSKIIKNSTKVWPRHFVSNIGFNSYKANIQSRDSRLNSSPGLNTKREVRDKHFEK